LQQAIKKSDCFARLRGRAWSCSHVVARSHTYTHNARHFHFAKYGKIIDLYKKLFGEYNKKNPALLTEDNIQLQLELIDGDLIIYAEFDSTWYKR
jgi:hypothetical protein